MHLSQDSSNSSIKKSGNNHDSVILIRHAQSQQNKLKKKIFNDIAASPQPIDPETHPQYIQMKYDLSLIDAQLSQQGVKQAYKAKQKLKNTQIDVVVVSPLRRALQTCQIIFKEKTNIKVYVQPLLTEGYHAACDIGGYIQESLAKYKDQFCFNKLTEQQWRTWYIDQLQNQQIRNQIFNFPQNTKSIHQHAVNLLKIKKQFQSPQQLYNRCKRLKKQLQKYQEKSYKKMAILGHYFIIKNFTCEGYGQKYSPINGVQLWNAEIKEHKLIYD